MTEKEFKLDEKDILLKGFKRQIQDLIRVCFNWNKKVLSSDEAMTRIWELFKGLNLKYWNRELAGEKLK